MLDSPVKWPLKQRMKRRVNWNQVNVDFCSALSWFISHMEHINSRSYSFTCHPHVYPQVEWAIVSALTPQLHSVTTLWAALISCPDEDRKWVLDRTHISLGGWLWCQGGTSVVFPLSWASLRPCPLENLVCCGLHLHMHWCSHFAA